MAKLTKKQKEAAAKIEKNKLYSGINLNKFSYKSIYKSNNKE